jgi:hypothetical protein
LHAYLHEQPPAEFKAIFYAGKRTDQPWPKSHSPSLYQNQGDSERLYTAPYEGADTHLGPRSKQDFATSFNNLLKAGSKVIFCGSKEVGKAQVEVMNGASEIHDALRRFEDSHPVNANPPTSYDEIAHFVNDVAGKLIDQLWVAKSDFDDAARKDLGFPPAPRTSSAPPPTNGRTDPRG